MVGSAPFSLLISQSPSAKLCALAWARQVWETDGARVQAVCPSTALAERLTSQSGFIAMSLHELERQPFGADRSKPAAVLLIDDAGLMNARQLSAVLTRAMEWEARVVVIADIRDFQAAEVGAAVRALAERHGALAIRSSGMGFDLHPIPARLGPEALGRQIGEPSAASMTQAYIGRFAERRSLSGRMKTEPERTGPVRVAASERSPRGPAPGWDERSVHRAIRGYARTAMAIEATHRCGGLATADQRRALARAEHRVACLWSGADETLAAACVLEPALLKAAADGGTRALLSAMEMSQEQARERRILDRWRDAAPARPSLGR